MSKPWTLCNFTHGSLTGPSPENPTKNSYKYLHPSVGGLRLRIKTTQRIHGWVRIWIQDTHINFAAFLTTLFQISSIQHKSCRLPITALTSQTVKGGETETEGPHKESMRKSLRLPPLEEPSAPSGSSTFRTAKGISEPSCQLDQCPAWQSLLEWEMLLQSCQLAPLAAFAPQSKHQGWRHKQQPRQRLTSYLQRGQPPSLLPSREIKDRMRVSLAWKNSDRKEFLPTAS